MQPDAPIGAHLSVAGGLGRCLTRATAVGAEVVQVFVGNPRAWADPTPDPGGDELFRQACSDAGLQVFVHAPYLINFGSPSPETTSRSAQALQFSLRRANAIGAKGVVMHAGSAVLGNDPHAAMRQARERLLCVLDEVDSPPLLIEPTAGGGGALAAGADSLEAYLSALGRDERVGVCLDTCHMHAAGHDLSTRASFALALRAYARAAGRTKIGLMHVNDSRDPVGSKRDRHAAIGSGTIGADAFGALFTCPEVRGVPLVVESDESSHRSDIEALAALRTIDPSTSARAAGR